MSVVHLHPEHIAAIVGSCATYDRIRFEGLHARNLLGQAGWLAHANARSHEDRYGEETKPVEVCASMINRWTFAPLTPVECLMALRSYEYQTCALECWGDSDYLGRETFDTLQSSAIRALTQDTYGWCITQPPAGSEGVIRII